MYYSLDSKYAKLPLYQLTQMLTEYDHAKNATKSHCSAIEFKQRTIYPID